MNLRNHETAEQMRQRLERESFWRSVFWQGENGNYDAKFTDDAYLAEIVNRELTLSEAQVK